jgi:hypothetical protein
MRFHPVLAFAALVIGSALGTLHGCSVAPGASTSAHAETGSSSSAGGGGPSCAPVTCVAPGPQLITTYADLFATLKSGARVRTVLDYSKCQLEGNPAPNAIGAMNLDTFEWFGPKVVGNPKAYIAASESHLVKMPSAFIYNYVRLRISEDEKVAVEVKYVDPVTFAVTVDELIECEINDGTNDRGASFYKL